MQNALGEPVVQAALASGAQFGAVTPGGFFTELRVGERSFTSHGTTSECGDAQNCADGPRAVTELLTRLQGFAAEQVCDP